jgi:hypothetical protein
LSKGLDANDHQLVLNDWTLLLLAVGVDGQARWDDWLSRVEPFI